VLLFSAFVSEREGKLSARKAVPPEREVCSWVLVFKLSIVFFWSKRSVSFCGFQNEREGKLSARKAIPPECEVCVL
jgi:hypothetical protein